MSHTLHTSLCLRIGLLTWNKASRTKLVKWYNSSVWQDTSFMITKELLYTSAYDWTVWTNWGRSTSSTGWIVTAAFPNNEETKEWMGPKERDQSRHEQTSRRLDSDDGDDDRTYKALLLHWNLLHLRSGFQRQTRRCVRGRFVNNCHLHSVVIKNSRVSY